MDPDHKEDKQSKPKSGSGQGSSRPGSSRPGSSRPGSSRPGSSGPAGSEEPGQSKGSNGFFIFLLIVAGIGVGLLTAAAQAQKAADYIQNVKHDEA